MLTVTVVDDLVALLVIATVYTSGSAPVRRWPGRRAASAVALLMRTRLRATRSRLRAARLSRPGLPSRVGRRPDRRRAGDRAWSRTPRPAARADLERATDLFRGFREQPTPELARSARRRAAVGAFPERPPAAAAPPLDELRHRAAVRARERRHRDRRRLPRAGVPLAGHAGDRRRLRRRQAARHRAPPSWLSRLDRMAGSPPVGWGRRWRRRPRGHRLHGVPADRLRSLRGRGVGARRSSASSSPRRAAPALLDSCSARPSSCPDRCAAPRAARCAERIVDLAIRSTRTATTSAAAHDAPVTLVEYGDFECPYCGQAEPVIRELLADFGDLRYVWRHLPLSDVHPHAQLAAEAAEAAAAQGAFWAMHDLLLAHQDALAPRRPGPYAEQLGLDVERFVRRSASARARDRVAEDVESADLSGAPARPPSSSTAAATTAPTTSAASPRRCRPPAHERRSPPSGTVIRVFFRGQPV